ncbi:MAG: tripartite tricarboxylate transporter substrate binding protein [Hyphomicrobiaceae bacterium]|nr:tripartite tricarboxylate transporter substrate binding protein [Hyphomicrobiaceae bacterium]
MLRRTLRSVAAAGVAFATALGLAAPDAAKAEYPDKPINILVGFAAGGGIDTYARAFAAHSLKTLKIGPVVVNKPGAGSMIAVRALLDARGDGYTLLMQNSVTMLSRLLTDGAKGEAMLARMQPIGAVGELVTALGVPADSPFKTAKDLVEYAKKNPGKLRWSHPGRGSVHTLAGMLFLKENGIKAQDVPFKGGAPSRNALAGKQVDFSFMGVQLLTGFETKIRALAVASTARDVVYKDIPTFKELGLPELGISAPVALWGSKDLPKPVVEKLRAAVKEAATQKAYVDMVRKTGLGGFHIPKDALEERMKLIRAKLGPIIQEMNVKKK